MPALDTDIGDLAQQFFDELINDDETVAKLIEKLSDGTATYIDAERYAEKLGGHSGQAAWRAYRYTTSAAPDEPLQYELAEELITSRMRSDFDDVIDYASKVQDTLNREAGLTMKPVIPEYSSSRATDLAYKLSVDPGETEQFRDFLKSAIQNAAQSAVDSMQEKNMEAQYDAGLRPTVHRIASGGKVCAWCMSLNGVYDYYPGMNTDVFRRHQNCNCLVYYDPGTGRRYQDVWSKRYF